MLISIAGVLDAAALAAIREALAAPGLFHSGAGTAAGRARTEKNNEQLLADKPAARGVLKMIERRILENETFAAAARPRALVRLTVNRYGPGMAYGAHVDAALIDGRRTDLSFTLFLSEPREYEGGALVIETAAGETEVRLPAGALALYPAGTVHRVTPVTAGARLAAVGWVRSLIRSPERRALLFELEGAIADSREEAVSLRLANIRNNLLRMWAED